MWTAIAGIIQIIYLLLKNNFFEKDAEERKRKEELHVEAKETIKSMDAGRVTALLDRLHNK